MKTNNTVIRKFKLTELALKNNTTVIILIISLFIFGWLSYRLMPKELFPDAKYPTIFIQTPYPGNSPQEIENLITKPLEKELKSIEKINDIKSVSAQDVSMIFLEFKPDVDIDKVLSDVKDAVDKIKPDLPDDLPSDPNVQEIDLSNLPIISINIFGDFNIDQLKNYAEYLKDEIEKVPEVSEVKIKGLSKKEVQVNIDLNALEQLHLSFQQIENAIKTENLTISAGEIQEDNTLRSIRIIGKFKNIDQIKNLIILNLGGKKIYLKDIADVKFTYADPENYARIDGKPVITLQIIKKSNQNLVDAVMHSIEAIQKAKREKRIPDNLQISYTNDQSKIVNKMINNLQNNMIMGIILVVLILFLFLGLRNSTLVGFSIPMSMFISYLVLAIMGEAINMISLFGLILALGMLVDNAIVVTENIYRFVDKGYKLNDASLYATSEIAIPITTSTLTTLAAFLPLLFWNAVTGMFMKLLPKTLIIVLSASLFTALIITPVLAKWLIKKAAEIHKPKAKTIIIWTVSLILLSILFYLLKKYTIANLLIISAISISIYTFVLFDVAKWFQDKLLPWLEYIYLKFINFSLKNKNPLWLLIFTTMLLFLTITVYFKIIKPKISFFPDTEPRYINVFIETPYGSTLDYTDSIMRIVEKDVNKFLKPYQQVIDSKLVTVGNGVARPREIPIGKTFNKGMITITFVDEEYRNGISTSEITHKLSIFLKNRYSGVNVFIEKDKHGPPVGKPINIEISGDSLYTLLNIADSAIQRIEKANIHGIEKLKIDIETGKPELIISLNREKLKELGLSTAQIAMTLRNEIFGLEASKYKYQDDEYPIMLRLDKKFRNDLSSLLNQTFPIKTLQGKIIRVPLSSVASIKFSTGYDAIKHINTKRTITIYSNVIEGYNANTINQLIKAELRDFRLPEGYSLKFTGEQKSMKESMQFMVMAMLAAMVVILMILITQFNSLIKPLIILASVIFSTIGVFFGYAILNMDIVIIMTGIGIIALAGVVVNNAIVLIDYIDLLKLRRKKQLGIEENQNLPAEEIKQAIIEAGKTRLRPVLLTALTTIFGLIPMAIGLNIDFGSLLSSFNGHIYLGGTNADFWSPLAISVIFGLGFATFLTLIMVPVMYWLANKTKLKIKK